MKKVQIAFVDYLKGNASLNRLIGSNVLVYKM